MLIEDTGYTLPINVASDSLSDQHQNPFAVFGDSAEPLGISTFVDTLYRASSEEGFKNLNTVTQVNGHSKDFIIDILSFANDNMLTAMLSIAEAKVAIKNDAATSETINDILEGFTNTELSNSEALKSALFNKLNTSTTANSAYDEFINASYTKEIANASIVDMYEEYFDAVTKVKDDTAISDDDKIKALSALKDLIA